MARLECAWLGRERLVGFGEAVVGEGFRPAALVVSWMNLDVSSACSELFIGAIHDVTAASAASGNANYERCRRRSAHRS